MLSSRCLPALFALSAAAALAAEPAPVATRMTADYVPPELAQLTKPASSELRELVERFTTDRDELERFYSVRGSALYVRRMREFCQAWQQRLGDVAFDRLGVEGRIDWTLLRSHLTHELRLLDRDEARAREIAPLLPFAEEIARLQESRRLMEPVEPKAAAAMLEQISKELEQARAGLEAGSVEFEYTGGNRGWKGDVPVVRLNTDRIRGLGWSCSAGSREALRKSMLAMLPVVQAGRL